jgi:putative motility protein YjfB-like
MDITNTSAVTNAVAGAEANGDDVGVGVLKKALDSQAALGASLIDALPKPQQLATEGSVGRNVNTYA